MVTREDYERKNLRTDIKVELKSANKAWLDCLERNFMKQWIAGADIKVGDVCVDEYSRMAELDAEVYSPSPYKISPTLDDLVKNNFDPNLLKGAEAE